jgi:capsid protein
MDKWFVNARGMYYGNGSYSPEGETMANLAETLRDLVRERSRMAGQVRKLDKAIGVLRQLTKGNSGSVGRQPRRKRRAMSAAARKKIAAAQRARWAKWKAKKAA